MASSPSGSGGVGVVPWWSHWIFAGQSCAPLILLTVCRWALLRMGLVQHTNRRLSVSEPGRASRRLLALGAGLASAGRALYLAVCPVWESDLSSVLVQSPTGGVLHLWGSLLVPTSSLLLVYLLVPTGLLPFFSTLWKLREHEPQAPPHTGAHGKGAHGRSSAATSAGPPLTSRPWAGLGLRVLPLIGLVSSVATYPEAYGARHLRAPPACPTIDLPTVLYYDALETLHVCALVASLLCVLPSRTHTRLSEDANQAGIAAFLLHAPMWPLLRPVRCDAACPTPNAPRIRCPTPCHIDIPATRAHTHTHTHTHTLIGF